MNDEVLKKDPHAKKKKTAVTVVIAVLAGLTIVVFLSFGALLRDFLIFDANRTQASNELTNIRAQVKEQENQLKIRKADLEGQYAKGLEQLKSLEDTIAKRESQIASQQKIVDECAVLSEKVNSLKRDYQVVLDDLKATLEKVAVEKGMISTLKSENDTLITKKTALQTELAELKKVFDEGEKTVAQINAEIVTLEQDKASGQTEVVEVRKALNEVATNLTSQNIKEASTRRAISQLEDEASRVKLTYDSLSAQVALAKETVKCKLVEKEELEMTFAELTQKKKDLSAVIAALEERKRNAEVQAKATEAKAEQASIRLKDINKASEADSNQPVVANESPVTTNPNKN